MKKVLRLLGVFGLITLLTSGLFANGINLNSIGTKALSMGGAFIGLADDYSAVFWNPAGLTQMKTSNVAIFGSAIIPKVSYKTDFFVPFGLPAIDAESKSKVYPNPGLGYFHVVNEKLVVGIMVYSPSGIGSEWEGSDLTNFSPDFVTSYEWASTVGAITVSPVIAYQVSDTFSLGATVNINYGMLDIKRPALGQYTEKLDGIFVNATLGALWKAADFLSIGATVKLPSKLKVSGDATMSGAPLLGLSATSTAEREISWPLWFGVGVAIKPCSKITITADVQYTNWEKVDQAPIIFGDAFWKAVGFEQASALVLDWEDKIQLRFGIQYLLAENMALRAGFYNDPAPSTDTTLSILLPSISSNWVSVGFGFWNEKFNLDIGFEYNLGGTEREADFASALLGEAMPGMHNLSVFVPSIGFTYKF